MHLDLFKLNYNVRFFDDSEINIFTFPLAPRWNLCHGCIGGPKLRISYVPSEIDNMYRVILLLRQEKCLIPQWH